MVTIIIVVSIMDGHSILQFTNYNEGAEGGGVCDSLDNHHYYYFEKGISTLLVLGFSLVQKSFDLEGILLPMQPMI